MNSGLTCNRFGGSFRGEFSISRQSHRYSRKTRLRVNFPEKVQLQSKAQKLQMQLRTANLELKQSSATVEHLQKQLQESEKEVFSMGRNLESLQIERDGLRIQQGYHERLVRSLTENDPDAVSATGIDDTNTIASRPTNPEIASTGPNGSLHVPVTPSVAELTSTITSTARRHRALALRVFVRNIPSRTCHKLIVATIVLLTFYTAL